MAWVDACKNPHETETEWMMREAFLKKNLDDVPKKILIMLSRVFVNHYLMRCSYSDEVIERVKALAVGIDLQRLKKEKRQLTNLSAANRKKFAGEKLQLIEKPDIQFVESEEEDVPEGAYKATWVPKKIVYQQGGYNDEEPNPKKTRYSNDYYAQEAPRKNNSRNNHY
uniref:XRN2-binding (XTBD) domain-containing protein n=1 Tax=Rhabditophanes sp. KR3021 TaxID=114890 RepID=A0AC35TN82_9BILA